MIRITDRTLSCLDSTVADRSDLLRLLELLIQTAVDRIELSEKMYNLLSPLPDYPAYMLRIENDSAMRKYLDVPYFICRNALSAAVSNEHLRSEILLNDIREAYTIARYSDCSKIRIQGLNDVLLGDYRTAFKNIRKSFHGDIEFCPDNRSYTATAISTEWVINNMGDNIVTSFCGIGGFAPTEEMIIILKERRLRKVGKNYPFFPEMASVIEKITGTQIRDNKPIIGKRIFHVESGIHVDGIIKQPKCYEPFPPNVVGQTRKIVLGKQSGAASIRVKLEELGIKNQEEQVAQILEQVKRISAEKNGALTDMEFENLIGDFYET